MPNISLPIQYKALQYTQHKRQQPVRFASNESGEPGPRNVTLSKEQVQVMARSMVRMVDHLLSSNMQDRSEVYNEAAEALEGAITLYEMAYDTLNPDLARAHKQLGMIRLKQGNPKEAEKHLKEAKRILESNNTHHPDLPGVLKGLVRVYQQTGRHDEAESLQAQADKIQGANNWLDKIH